MRARAGCTLALPPLLWVGWALLFEQPAFAQTGTESESGTRSEAEPGDRTAASDGASEPTENNDEPPVEVGGDDWDLPEDLDDEDGSDTWDFDAALAEADEHRPPDLPVFGETTFTLTNTTRGQYRFENYDANDLNDHFFSAWERLEGAMQGEELRASARLDFFLPLGQSDCTGSAAGDCIEGDVRLERFSLHWERGPWKLDGVDSYAVLGRGIALSFRRLDILGIDTSLRGGQVAYDDETIFFKVLGGAANPQNLDPNTLAIIRRPTDQLRRSLWKSPDTRDWIMGTELGYRLPGLELGAHAARYMFASDDSTGFRNQTDLNILGWHLELPRLVGGRVSFYGEANLSRRQTHDDLLGEHTNSGRAIYASFQIAASDRATLAFEWKDYRRFYVADKLSTPAHRVYSAAPNLEGEYERPEDLGNARGGRLQMDYAFGPGDWGLSAAVLSYGHAEHRDSLRTNEGDPWSSDGFWLNHLTLKVQRLIRGEVTALAWTFDLLGGYRDDRYLGARDGREGGNLHWRVIHGQLEAGIVAGPHSLELTFIHRQESKWNVLLLNFDDYVRGSLSLTYSWKGRVRVSPVLAWNNEWRDSNTPVLYPGIEARFDFMEGSFLRVFGGSQPGGRICSGGVCRDVPLFQGILGELVLRL